MRIQRSQIILFFCLSFLVLVSYFYHGAQNDPREILGQFYGQKNSLEGVVVSEPEQRTEHWQFEFAAEHVPGKILVTVPLYRTYQYGDRIKVSGKLNEPPQFDDFDYRAFLAKDGIYGLMFYPVTELVGSAQANWFYERIFEFKSRLRSALDNSLLPPQSSLLRAIFLGEQDILSDELKEKLNITGTRHIAAVSGAHMVIMTQILLAVALAFGFWRQHAFYLVLFLLAAYIIMVGAPASAVRSGIMSFFILLAQQAGRLNSAARSIVFAAAGMLIINPSLISADVGFQLSFMAVLSIIYLKPILDRFLFGRRIKFLRDILSMTLAAQIGVLPLLIFHFGQISLVSLFANLAVVPLMPLVMIGGFGLSAAGLVWLGLAKILAWPVWLLLSLVIKLIDFFAAWPGAYWNFQSFSVVFLTCYYPALIVLICLFRRKTNFYLKNDF